MKYVYYVLHKTTGQKYIGSRYAIGADPAELWITYFTSSKRVKALIEEFGKEDFIVSVRKTFETKEECFLYETKLLSRLQCSSRKDFLNKHNNDKLSCRGGGLRSRTVRRKLCDYYWFTDGKQDIRLHNTKEIPENFIRGRTNNLRYGPRSAEFKAKMRQLRLGKKVTDPAALLRIKETRVGMAGKKHSERTKQLLSIKAKQHEEKRKEGHRLYWEQRRVSNKKK